MMKEEFYIRSLNAGDAADFKNIRLLAISDSPTTIWPTMDEESGRTHEEIFARIVRTSHQIVFGTFIGSELVAILGLRREILSQVAHKATLWGMFVHPDFRKEGLARQLLNRAREHATEIGILQIHLAVNSENLKAKSLYHSLGFRTFGFELSAMKVGMRFYDEEHMYLRLHE